MPFQAPSPQFKTSLGKPGAPSGVQPTPQSSWPADDDPTWTLVGLPAAQVRAFDTALTGFVTFPGLANYETARAGEPEWPTPALIAYAMDEQDVIACLALVTKTSMLVSVRSGGHNAAGYHLSNGLVIDVSSMDSVAVNIEDQTVTVGPGTTFASLDANPALDGLALPEGTCSNVCCAGYFMGGGYSLASRSLGMGCDSLVSARVITASGAVVQASPSGDADLLWALRGGSGGQFGVTTQLTLQGHTPNSFWGFVAQWPLTLAVDVLGWLEEHATSSAQPTPDPFGYLALMSYLVGGDPVKNGGKGPIDAEPSVAVLGMYHGSMADGKAALADLLAIGPAELRYSVQDRFSVINNDVFLFLPYVALGLDTVPSLSASGFVGPDQRPDWAALAEAFAAAGNQANLIGIEPYGGAIAAADASTAAFPHREQKLDLLVDSFWSPSWTSATRADAERWLDAVMHEAGPALSGRTYANYADRSIRDYRSQYWAQSFDRLLATRQRLDPTDAFRFDQSISWAPSVPPAGAQVASS